MYRNKKLAISITFFLLTTPIAYAMEPGFTPSPVHAPATEQELKKLARAVTRLHTWWPTQEVSSHKDHKFWLIVSGMQLIGDVLSTYQVYSIAQRRLICIGLLGHMLDQMFIQQHPVVDQEALNKVAQEITAAKREGSICSLEEALIQEMAVPLFGWLKQHLK